MKAIVRASPLALGGLTWALLVLTGRAAVPNVTWERLGDGPDRALHSMVYDPPNDLFWQFGGVQASMWSNDVYDTLYRLTASDPTARWQLVTISGLRPPQTVLHSAVYDPPRRRMLVYGGRDRNGLPVDGNHVWLLDLSDAQRPVWSRQSIPGGPSARFAHAATYVERFDAMVISGGVSGAGSAAGLRSDNFALLLGEVPMRWVRLATAGMTGRAGHHLTFDEASQRLLSYGGVIGQFDTSDLDATRELLQLDMSQQIDTDTTWSRLDTASPGEERAFMAAVYDPVRRLVWVHGGLDRTNFRRDLSVLDLSVSPPDWVRTQVVVNGPLDRFGHAHAWDSRRQRMVVHGGSPDNARTKSDTYGLSGLAVPGTPRPTTPPPTRVSPTTTPATGTASPTTTPTLEQEFTPTPTVTTTERPPTATPTQTSGTSELRPRAFLPLALKLLVR